MKHIKLFEQFINEGKLNYKDTGLKGEYLKDVKDGVIGIKRALKTGNRESLISNYDIIQQRVQQYGEGPNKYDFLEAVQKLAGLEESVNESKYLPKKEVQAIKKWVYDNGYDASVDMVSDLWDSKEKLVKRILDNVPEKDHKEMIDGLKKAGLYNKIN